MLPACKLKSRYARYAPRRRRASFRIFVSLFVLPLVVSLFVPIYVVLDPPVGRSRPDLELS